MTESGEQLTVKGEFNTTPESVFAFNSSMEVSYKMRVGNRNRVEIGMRPPASETDIFRMIFVLKGQISFGENNDNKYPQVISTQQHNLCRIPRSSKFMLMDSIKDEVICINLSNAFMRKYIPESHPAHQSLFTDNAEATLLMPASTNLPITPEMSTILQRLGNSLQDGFFDQLLLESKVIELLAFQIAQFEVMRAALPANQLNNATFQKMNKAREILISNCEEQLSLRTLAHLVGTNEFNLKRDFKAAFGYTVYGYLNHHKMEQAKAMLLENSESISEISRKMGYRYPTHFTSAFKKYFGYLPNKLKNARFSLLFFVEDIWMLLENLDVAFT